MENGVNKKELFFKLIPFSLLILLISLIGWTFFIVGTVVGFILGASSDQHVLGLILGFIIGILITFVYAFTIHSLFHAAFIAVITKSIATKQLPVNPIKEGFAELKGRYGKVFGFTALNSIITGALHGVGSAASNVAGRVGGSVAGSITEAANSLIQTYIRYVSDCVLGWVFYKKEEKLGKAASEGVAIFFKNKEQLLKNSKKILGYSFISFAAICLPLIGISYLIIYFAPGLVELFTNEFATSVDIEFFVNPALFGIIFALLFGILGWRVIHETFVYPFILVDVMKTFMEAGKVNAPDEEEIRRVQLIAPRFAKFDDNNK